MQLTTAFAPYLRKMKSALAASSILALGALAALAANPHFQNFSSGVNGDAQLVASWTEAGLGTADASYQLIGSATAEWACVNKGGHIAQATQFMAFGDQVFEQATFSTKNGSANGTFTADAPAATLSCPGGQVAKLFSVTYTNLVLYDLTNSLQLVIPDATRSFSTGMIP